MQWLLYTVASPNAQCFHNQQCKDPMWQQVDTGQNPRFSLNSASTVAMKMKCSALHSQILQHPRLSQACVN
jgi:hypothetical protein